MSNRLLMPSGRKASRLPLKMVKDKEECNQKLQEATEALANYKGKDENLPQEESSAEGH